MATTVTIKLNKPANVFQAGESTGFGIRGGVRYYDRETKQNEWTNYEAVIFARQQGQIDFYTQALVEGSIVEVTGKQEKIRTFEGQSGTVLSIELIDASLGFIGTAGAAKPAPQQGYNQAPAQQPAQPQNRPAPQQQMQRGGYQQNQPQQNQGQGMPTGGWDDSQIPF